MAENKFYVGNQLNIQKCVSLKDKITQETENLF